MKFKNYTKHLVAFIMLLTTLHAYAASVGDSFSYECEDGKYLIFEITHSNTIKLTEVDDYECTGEVIIPFLVNFDASSYIVTEIGDWACNSRENITSVTIPESVTKIGKRAFNNCSSLTTITIPKSVTEIGERALAGCDNLTAINVDSNNLHYTSEEGVLFNIEKTKLIQCPPAKYGTFTIPDGVDILENFAFTDSKLTSIIIPNSVTKIGENVFEDAQNLTSIEIPNNITSLGEYLLAGCSSLNDVKLSNNITTIPVGCFAECTGLTSINIPNGVTTIDEEAFAETGLTSINFPESIKFIGDYAFAWSRLTSVVIPEGVETIGEVAFVECDNLKTVTIPKSVTNIAMGAFGYNASLTSITVDSENLNYLSENGILFNKEKTTIIQYPGAKQGAYTIPESVTKIGYAAFSNCWGLTYINIHNNVTSIENEAFYRCENLNNVIIPEGITVIERNTFARCFNMKWVKIPSSVNEIRDYSFIECGLTEIFCLNPEPPLLNDDIPSIFEAVDKSIPVYIPIGSISKYKSAEGWNEFTNFIESDFTGIEDSNISATEIKVFAGNGIDICNYYGNLQVINLAGQVVKETYVNGSAQITLPKGAYIIVTENKSQKVVL